MVDSLSLSAYMNFVLANTSPDRLVVSGVNVNHEEFVELADKCLGELAPGPAAAARPSMYTGGEARMSATGPANVALAFNGVSWDDPDLVPTAVLHSLLGGGGSFSSGGPGKGMYTRLYTNILTQEPWVINAQAFNHVYTDGGLFGISASADPDRLGDLAKLVGEHAAAMTMRLSDEEVMRAKNQTISGLAMNLESRTVLCEDMGRQLGGNGKYVDSATLISKIEKVDKDDLLMVSKKMLGTAPTLILRGEMFDTPSMAQIGESFKSLQLQ